MKFPISLQKQFPQLNKLLLPAGSLREKWLSGLGEESSTYVFASWLLPRALGFVALIAVLSFWTQYKGLIGTEGILPFSKDLEAVTAYCETNPESPQKYLLRPTVLWLWEDPDNSNLQTILVVTFVASLFAISGIAQAISLALIWLGYLSLYAVGSPFLSFQWDILLLESLFLVTFATIWTRRSRLKTNRQMPAIGRWLCWTLLAKLMFESGLVKLTYYGANDENTWRELTALQFHYWTQPIPAWTSWYIHHLPEWFDRLCLQFMLVVELALPFLFFLPRRLRHASGIAQIFLQTTILISGNYGFFNVLTIVLCIPLFDDQFLPEQLRQRILSGKIQPEKGRAKRFIQTSALVVIGTLHIWMTKGFISRDIAGNRPSQERTTKEPPQWQSKLKKKIQILHIANSYGLFRVMTTSRPEIEIAGSYDAKTWKKYKFHWKPGDLDQSPKIFIPHMPRLDWQMWFAGLRVEAGSFRQAPPWLVFFVDALTEQRSDVLSLIKEDPFPDQPPNFIRLRLHNYTFTTPEERKATGHWWNKALLVQHTLTIPVRGHSD